MTSRDSWPAPLTTFVGREAELAALSETLGDARLVTLVGPGGCGKTRLALALAGGWTRTDAGWAALATTTHPPVVPERVAAAGGVLLAADRDAPRSLARQLGGRPLLLCVDNC